MMLGARQYLEGAAARILPAGYTLLSYVQPSGNAYFDLGFSVIGHAGPQVEVSYCFPSRPSSEAWVFGIWGGGVSTQWASYLIGYFPTRLRSEAGPDISQYWAAVPWDSSFHVGAVKNDGCYMDGVRLADAKLSELPNGGPLRLGVANHQVNLSATRRVRHCKVWTSGGAPMLDMVACLDPGGVACMYDFVAGKPMYKSGSGYMLGGPAA